MDLTVPRALRSPGGAHDPIKSPPMQLPDLVAAGRRIYGRCHSHNSKRYLLGEPHKKPCFLVSGTHLCLVFREIRR
jgi:hypothetical protein